MKGNFSEGAWKDVSQGDAVYAIPVDGGPMGMIYRTDIFDKYGITPPTTWDEFEAAAQKVKDAGGPVFGDLGANVPATFMALLQQNGAEPFTYDPAKPKDMTIKLNDQASRTSSTTGPDLVKKGLVGTEDQFTTDYISGVVGGKYATYLSAAWAPGYLTGAGVGEGSSKGVWAAAPLPQWDPANPVSVNWGGSAFAVTTQATNKRLAAKVALGIYADPTSLEDGWKKQIIFPLNKTVLDSDDFVNNKVGVLQRPAGQQGRLRPGRERLQGHRLRPYPGLLLRTAPSAARQDQRRQDDRRPGGRRPAGTDRQVRQEPGLHRHRVTRGRSRSPPVRPGGQREPPGRASLTRSPRMTHATAVDTPSPPNQPTAPAVSHRRRSLNERKKARIGWLFVAPFAARLPRFPDPAPGLRVLPQPVQQGTRHGRRLRRCRRTTSTPSPTRRSSTGSGSSSGSRWC